MALACMRATAGSLRCKERKLEFAFAPEYHLRRPPRLSRLIPAPRPASAAAPRGAQPNTAASAQPDCSSGCSGEEPGGGQQAGSLAPCSSGGEDPPLPPHTPRLAVPGHVTAAASTTSLPQARTLNPRNPRRPGTADIIIIRSAASCSSRPATAAAPSPAAARPGSSRAPVKRGLFLDPRYSSMEGGAGGSSSAVPHADDQLGAECGNSSRCCGTLTPRSTTAWSPGQSSQAGRSQLWPAPATQLQSAVHSPDEVVDAVVDQGHRPPTPTLPRSCPLPPSTACATAMATALASCIAHKQPPAACGRDAARPSVSSSGSSVRQAGSPVHLPPRTACSRDARPSVSSSCSIRPDDSLTPAYIGAEMRAEAARACAEAQDAAIMSTINRNLESLNRRAEQERLAERQRQRELQGFNEQARAVKAERELRYRESVRSFVPPPTLREDAAQLGAARRAQAEEYRAELEAQIEERAREKEANKAQTVLTEFLIRKVRLGVRR